MYDIVVIGAGPAGSTFAREIDYKNKKVLLIDNQNINNKKPCGGLLAPEAQKTLARYNLVLPKSVLVDPQIFSVKTIDLATKNVKYYQRYYLNMDRYKFDKWLVSLIKKEIEIINDRVIKVERCESYYKIYLKNKIIESKIVIGADGCNGIVRNTFYKNNIYKYIAIQEWYKCKDISNSFYSCIFDSKTSDSCSWLIYKDEYLIYGGSFRLNDGKKMFDYQKERIEKFLNIKLENKHKTESCLVYRPKRMRDFINGSDGVYLIGEAAGFISASSFEGISSAIRSATILANIINKNSEINVITKKYKAESLSLKIKLFLKIIKRWFMYTGVTRNIIMNSKIKTIRVKNNN